jgi:large subunit ribosomal protein L14
MIFSETILNTADNSGAQIVKCLMIVKKPVGFLGDVIKLTLKKFVASKKLIKGKKYFGLLISIKKNKRRLNGYRLKFSQNRVLIFSENDKFVGTRVYGPTIRELKRKLLINRFKRVISQGQKIL